MIYTSLPNVYLLIKCKPLMTYDFNLIPTQFRLNSVSIPTMYSMPQTLLIIHINAMFD